VRPAYTQHELYPSRTAYVASGGEGAGNAVLAFLGRMLGKALWEGVLLELPLAGFFLRALRGARPGLHDLPSLDAQLYRNLLALRTYTVRSYSQHSHSLVHS
jgi:ubiquitin-protein ligase E3 C